MTHTALHGEFTLLRPTSRAPHQPQSAAPQAAGWSLELRWRWTPPTDLARFFRASLARSRDPHDQHVSDMSLTTNSR
jgi:hypothetical protein